MAPVNAVYRWDRQLRRLIVHTVVYLVYSSVWKRISLFFVLLLVLFLFCFLFFCCFCCLFSYSYFCLQCSPFSFFLPLSVVIEGNEILYRDYIDISVAVATPKVSITQGEGWGGGGGGTPIYFLYRDVPPDEVSSSDFTCCCLNQGRSRRCSSPLPPPSVT